MDVEELDQKIQALATEILKTRDEAVQFRASSGVERRWREDDDLVEGLDGNTKNRSAMVDYATGESWVGQKKDPPRSKVVVNIIRGKCNTAEGRFAEICLPTDDLNFGLILSKKVSSANSPEVAQAVSTAMGSQPMQQTQGASAVDGQMLAQARASAQTACDGMQDEIEDQLEECDFNNECRKVVSSAVRRGTGILKGPLVVKAVQKAWIKKQAGASVVYVMEREEKHVPVSKGIDVWNVFPDPDCGEEPKKGRYIWERDDHMLPRDLRALIGVPGYSTRQIEKVLAEQPKRTTVVVDKGGNTKVNHAEVDKGAAFERWEYHGDVERSALEAMGCKCPEKQETLSACVVFVNDRPIKMVLNTLDSGELPYDFYQWEQVAGSCWGIGEPRKLMWPCRIMNAGWRAMMDNAGDSATGILVMRDDLEPDDEMWNMSGKRVYRFNGDDNDARRVFQQHQIANNQKELQNIIELALKFTDLESGTPALAQGEKGTSPETLGGMELLMKGADTNRRRQVKRWDDQITRPHIGRYRDWNMQYNENNNIKGDFDVQARGASVLLMKEQAGLALREAFSLRADPELRIKINWEKALKQWMESRHLDILNTPEEEDAAKKLEMQKQQPMAPAVLAAQVRAQSAEKIEAARIEADSQDSEKDRQNKVFVEMINERMQMAELTSVERQLLDKLKVELANNAMKLNVQQRLSHQDMRHDQDLAVADHMMTLHERASPQVLTPPTEPAGRAPVGEAFAA